MYYKMNCGIYRIDVLEILEENGVLNKKIMKELKFDSMGKIRAMHRNISKEE